MPKFTSKAGVSIEAHVVGDNEKQLQASMGGGAVEHLNEGDALVTLRGKQYVVRAPLWDALFGESEARRAKEPDEEPGPKKGGQQASTTK